MSHQIENQCAVAWYTEAIWCSSGPAEPWRLDCCPTSRDSFAHITRQAYTRLSSYFITDSKRTWPSSRSFTGKRCIVIKALWRSLYGFSSGFLQYPNLVYDLSQVRWWSYRKFPTWFESWWNITGLCPSQIYWRTQSSEHYSERCMLQPSCNLLLLLKLEF